LAITQQGTLQQALLPTAALATLGRFYLLQPHRQRPYITDGVHSLIRSRAQARITVKRVGGLNLGSWAARSIANNWTKIPQMMIAHLWLGVKSRRFRHRSGGREMQRFTK
jgi:hypothetical protein